MTSPKQRQSAQNLSCTFVPFVVIGFAQQNPTLSQRDKVAQPRFSNYQTKLQNYQIY
jgi:hypothetical protein